MKLEPIIISLLDTDLYKFNMDQVIFHKHTDLNGEYYFRCRNEGVVFTQEMFDECNKGIPLQRHADPAEVAALYAFLASDEAKYITGQHIPLDGGETA